MKTILAVMAALVLLCLCGIAQANITIETVAVGDPGNTGELSGPGAVGGWGSDRICGSVAYTYNIGKYEITAAQYTAFLNAKAKSDTYGLYNTLMWSYPYGCKIQRSGTSGNYTYSVASNYANRPVNELGCWDMLRFANWISNGQGNGDTETGSYTMTTDGMTNNTITRNGGAKWVVTNEDEWYKAAYYKGGGTSAGYWDYPIRSDSIDTAKANYNWSVNGTTIAGSYAYPSAYGTFDQAGNVWELTEPIVGTTGGGQRGSAFNNTVQNIHAGCRGVYVISTEEQATYGFRLAYLPEGWQQPLAISAISPNSGPNTGSVSITDLAGTGFLTGATVKLTRAGQPDIAATGVTVVSATKITCTFDLTGKWGQWNVVVTNPDAQSATLTNGFTVNAESPVQWATGTGGNGHWYQVFYTPGRITWPAAVAASRLLGGHLATISSQPENAFVYSLISDNKLWLSSGGRGNGPWIGGYQDRHAPDYTEPAGGWRWVTGEPFTYTNWDPRQPDNDSGIEDCLHFWGDTNGDASKWNDASDTNLMYGYILEYDQYPVPAPTISGITPNSALNTGAVSITDLAGTGFQAGATVKLTKSGQSDIPATGVTSVSATRITCSFNLAGKAPGQWNVVLTNPDLQSATLTDGFTVNALTIGGSRSLPLGSSVCITDAVVTAPTLETGSVFVESSDRSGGIKLVTSQTFSQGDRVKFTGLTARVDGEYRIDNVIFTEPVAPGTVLSPLFMTTPTIGNDRTENLIYEGVNTTGMLVKLVGKVTGVVTAQKIAYLDDGGSYQDGYGPVLGLRCHVPSGVSTTWTNKYYAITGISRVQKVTLTVWGNVNGDWYAPGTFIYVPYIDALSAVQVYP